MKYIRLFENMSDMVITGDYVYYYNETKQRPDSQSIPFIIKVYDKTNDYGSYNSMIVALVLYFENNEWKICKENPKFSELISEFKMPTDSFNKYSRFLTKEEKEILKDLDYRLTAVDYNL